MNPDRPHVRVDPAQRFGQPNVRGISCEAIADMLLAEKDVDVVGDEYDITRADVLVVCWYLGLYGTRRWRRLWHDWAEAAGQLMWIGDFGAVPDPPTGGA